MRSTRTGAALAITAVAAASMLSACGSSSGGSGGKAGDVSITIEGWRPGSEQATIDAMKAEVAAFQKANPKIHVEPKEWEWKASTFGPQLAGGTLPTTFRVPFTDGKGLIARKQIADVTNEVKSLPYFSKFNGKVLSAAQSDDGKVFGIPSDAYGIGLHYNRTLFKQAGLDPDKPPTTWDEIRADAKLIAQKTGQAGYAEMTKDHTGGWMLTTFTYAMGGRMEQADGDKYKATLNNAGTKDALTKIKEMRWTDNSMGSNFLLDWSGINQEFAAGKIGMYMGGSDVYNALVTQNSIKPDDYGLAALPLGSGSDAGVLGGGSIAAVSAKATAAQRSAAMKWNDFHYMGKLTNQTAAVTNAKSLIDAKQPVGTPVLPIFDKASLDQYNVWIKDYINVPLNQMTSFTSGIFSQPLIPEPASHTQEVYALLDSVVQAVLTDKNADIDGLLSKANSDAQALLDKG